MGGKGGGGGVFKHRLSPTLPSSYSGYNNFWELNEVQSPYVVGLNKRNDFCEN